MDNMLSQGVKSIVDLARNELFRNVYSNASEITYLNMMTGEHKVVAKDEPPISHTLLDLDSLIRMIEEHHKICCGDEVIATFVSPTEVVTITDYSKFRVNIVKVPLTQSQILSFLRMPYEGTPKEAIRALKYNLQSAISGLEILPALRELKFETNSTADHKNAHNDESVSKSLKSMVSGAAEIPDEFNVVFPIYPSMSDEFKNQGIVGVKMELHVDPSAGTVSFRPFPGAIDAVTIEGAEIVRSEIAQRLQNKSLDQLSELVFLGKP